MQIFFSVGEPSGDLHGANLIRTLKQQAPQVRCTGYGGPRMQAEGCELEADLTQFAVMWFLSAIMQIGRFWRLYQNAKRIFRDQRPDAVVLIDYPGFNWWIARAAKRCGVPVYYYGVPQMWAWASWRIKKMRRLIDHTLCKLPFEAEWYQQRGCDAQYVGHPYFDELAERTLDQEFLAQLATDSRKLVTLLPGSRRQEVARNGPDLLLAAERAVRNNPHLRFAAACFNDAQREMLQQQLDQRASDLPIELHVGRTPELIEGAHCCLACSGSVSLELMCAAKPSAILYRMSRMQYAIGKRLVKVRYMTLVNLLAMEDRFQGPVKPFDPMAPGADRVPMPEYPTYEDRTPQLAAHIASWTTDEAAYDRSRQRLLELRDEFAIPGATARAASYLLTTLQDSAHGENQDGSRTDSDDSRCIAKPLGASSIALTVRSSFRDVKSPVYIRRCCRDRRRW